MRYVRVVVGLLKVNGWMRYVGVVGWMHYVEVNVWKH